MRLGLVEQLLAEVVGAGRGGRHRDRDEQARVVPLQDLRRAQFVGDRRGVLDLRFLKVEVERVQPVRVDDLLVGGRGGGGGPADLAELGAVVTARGHDHVAGLGAYLVDDRGHLRVAGHRVGPVPGRDAAAVRQDERDVERLLAGGRHDRAEIGCVRVEHAVVRRGLVPVGRQRGDRGQAHRLAPVTRGGRAAQGRDRDSRAGDREQRRGRRRDRQAHPSPPAPGAAARFRDGWIHRSSSAPRN